MIRTTLQAILAILAVATFLSVEVQAQPKETLVFGRVTKRPQKHYKRYPALVNYVVKRMADLGVKAGKIRLQPNNEAMIRELRKGRVDWVSETFFSSLLFEREAGTQVLLRRWKGGQPSYRSVMIARKDSGVKGFDDLIGKRIVFEDPGSTTAYFIPAAILSKAGYRLVQLSNPREVPPSNAIGYIFANGELNIATMVHRKIASAGAYAAKDWSNPKDTPPVFRKDMMVFYESEFFPRCLESVRGNLDPGIKKRLKAILLNAYQYPQGLKAMKKYRGTTRFDLLPPEQVKKMNEYRDTLKRFFNTH